LSGTIGPPVYAQSRKARARGVKVSPRASAHSSLVSRVGAEVRRRLTKSEFLSTVRRCRYLRRSAINLPRRWVLEKFLFTAATAAPDTRSGGLAPLRIHRLQAIVEEHLSQSIRLADLSGVVGLSVPHFSRAFRLSFGQPPHLYVIQRRPERARHLMLTSGIALSELAIVCGFNDQAHFCRLFRRCGSVRASPAQLRIAQLDIHRIALPKAQDGIDNCGNLVQRHAF
jgi:AraC-like DNA-binding protein